jgi:hypothetical protein
MPILSSESKKAVLDLNRNRTASQQHNPLSTKTKGEDQFRTHQHCRWTWRWTLAAYLAPIHTHSTQTSKSTTTIRSRQLTDRIVNPYNKANLDWIGSPHRSSLVSTFRMNLTLVKVPLPEWWGGGEGRPERESCGIGEGWPGARAERACSGSHSPGVRQQVRRGRHPGSIETGKRRGGIKGGRWRARRVATTRGDTRMWDQVNWRQEKFQVRTREPTWRHALDVDWRMKKGDDWLMSWRPSVETIWKI